MTHVQNVPKYISIRVHIKNALIAIYTGREQVFGSGGPLVPVPHPGLPKRD
jgi:hypothetical protein